MFFVKPTGYLGTRSRQAVLSKTEIEITIKDLSHEAYADMFPNKQSKLEIRLLCVKVTTNMNDLLQYREVL